MSDDANKAGASYHTFPLSSVLKREDVHAFYENHYCASVEVPKRGPVSFHVSVCGRLRAYCVESIAASHRVLVLFYDIFMWLFYYCASLPLRAGSGTAVDQTAKEHAADIQILGAARILFDIVSLISPSTPIVPRLNSTPTGSPVQTHSRFGTRSTQEV